MKRFVYIKAEVIEEQDKALTVRLLNGFGNPVETVHQDAIIEPATGGVVDGDAIPACVAWT